MIVVHDPDTLLHETVELLGARIIPAQESPARIEAILKALSDSEHDLRIKKSPFEQKSELSTLVDLICTTHGDAYLQHLQTVYRKWRDANLIEQHESVLPECFAFSNKARVVPQAPKDIYARAGYFAFDMSSGIMEKTYISVIASANLAMQAANSLSKDHNIYETLALCRPPGHHCDGHHAGGYCYVNNAAVAITTWRQHSPVARIGILDVDFHHGNGTQEIFYDDPKVFYTSIHGEDEFPYYTGRADETGAGDAVGTNLNFPLACRSSFEDYAEKLEFAISALSKFGPELLIVSLGFDTFHLDPLGCFEIETEDYEVMARVVRQRMPSVPAVILLEGGYAIEHLGANLLSFLKGWETKT